LLFAFPKDLMFAVGMEHYHHMSVWGALVEDSHPGHIWRIPNGTSLATYWRENFIGRTTSFMRRCKPLSCPCFDLLLKAHIFEKIK